MQYTYDIAWSNQGVTDAYGLTSFDTFPEAWHSFQSLKEREFYATLFLVESESGGMSTVADFKPNR